MGAIADFFVSYAQPLLDQTDGSHEQIQKAFGLAQVCYNLTLLPVDERELFIQRMQSDLGMDDVEFAEFRSGMIDPMIDRGNFAASRLKLPNDSYFRYASDADERARPKTTVDRYAPCPCQSGKKYKFCCGAK